ncbi:hypothetical protein ICN84_01470 [Akkermansia glycaniphila]|uniref:hypothetical protein n=1 Tax=Akkermansia glycaniphila TaxID=1679444 RepID=UPI001C023243|nr:hypothetical protein [Akkermansia glycaniphila]MBT9448739.1 hypothetical protein [Akkermansia glycaniphila]
MSTPDEIKAWLKRIGKTRAWLGEQLGTAKLTIDGWLNSGRPIPMRKQLMIGQLMETSELAGTDEILLRALDLHHITSFSCPVTAAEEKLIEKACRMAGITTRDLLRRGALKEARKILSADS